MSALRIEQSAGDVLRITIARPERRNAFDAALIAELTDAFAGAAEARAVVLAGEGPSFCAGADVEWQRSSIDLSHDENVADAMRLYRMLETIDGCPAPVVARVHGFALGGGSGMVACADVAVAGPDAVFGFTEVRLGIIPAVISPFVLGRIGSGAARRYLPDRRAVRRRRGAPHRPRPRDRRGSRRGRRTGGRRSSRRGPGSRAGGEAPDPRATARGGDRPGGRRAAGEPGGPGGPASVPGEAAGDASGGRHVGFVPRAA